MLTGQTHFELRNITESVSVLDILLSEIFGLNVKDIANISIIAQHKGS